MHQQQKSITSCFVDTGVFFASYYEGDALHVDGALLLLSATLGWFGKTYTSTYVFDETITLAKAKLGGNKAVELAEYILNSKKITLLSVEDLNKAHDTKLGKTLNDALSKFKKHSEMRGLSFTDCTSLTLLEGMKIKCVLSFDGNFRSFAPKLLGEGYGSSLDRGESEILDKAAKELGIKLR